MNFVSFLETVLAAVSPYFSPEEELLYRPVNKSNGACYTGLTFACRDGRTIAPIIYMEAVFRDLVRENLERPEALKENDFPISADALNQTVEKLVEMLHSEPPASVQKAVNRDYPAAKDHIVARFIGAEANREFLERYPHRLFLDMALVYTVYMEEKESAGAFWITHEMAESWGVTEEDLYSDAIRNMPLLLGEKSFPLGDLSAERTFYVLSNEKAYYGASALLYSTKPKEIADLYERDLFILPSSVHEVILLPECGQPISDLAIMVRTVNESELKREDILTGSVYRYARNTGEIARIC